MSWTVAASQSRDGPLLVGRARELNRLRTLLSAVCAGRSSFILLGGEAGIGKTTLVEALVREARNLDVRVLTGHCYDLTTTPPYGPWTETLRPVGADETVAPLLRGNAELNSSHNQIELFERVWAIIADLAAVQPILLVLEDLHWADEASLDLLRFIGRQLSIAPLPLLVIATYRDNDLTRQHPLSQLLPMLVREARAERISIHPFDTEATGALVRTRHALSGADEARLVNYLLRRSDGNPFFMSELLHSLEDEQLLRATDAGWHMADLNQVQIPPLVRQVIDNRVMRLSPTTRAALEIASVIGQVVAVDLWSAVSGLDEEHLADSVDDAVAVQVLEEMPERTGFRFKHALIREAIYESLALPRRRAWHRQVAEAMAMMTAANIIPGTAAYHFQQAGDERAVEWHVRAGLQASHFAWISAAHHFEAAAMLLEGDQARKRERAWLCFEASNLLSFTGNPHSIELLDEAAHIALEIGDAVLAALARIDRGSQRCMHGDIRRGLLDLREGVAVVDTLLETQQQLGLEVERFAVVQRLLPGDSVEMQRINAVLQHKRDVTDVNVWQGSFINWLGHTGRYHEAIARGEPFFDSMITGQFRNNSVLLGLGHAYAGHGRPDDARRVYRLARAAFSTSGNDAMFEHTFWHELVMVLIPYDTTQLRERAQFVAEAAEAWERCRGLTITTAGDGTPSRLPIDLLDGHWQQARQMSIDHLTAPWSAHVHEAIIVLGSLDRQQGHPNDAWKRVAELLPDGPDTEPGDIWFAPGITAIALAVELALDARDLLTAQHWIETHQRWLDWNGARIWLADNQLLRSRFHELSGDLSSAAHHAEAALTMASEPRQPLRLVAAHRLHGSLNVDAGRYDTATQQLAESLALADACAAPFERALTLLEMARLQLATEQPAVAQRLLDEARSICEPLGARPTLERVAALEARLFPRTSAPPKHPDGLTTREVEVLRLIAAGGSNRQIAETLFLSARTIERHIANIYLKIDAHSKADATAYAFRHGLIAGSAT